MLKRILKGLAATVVAMVIGAVVVIAMQPSDFRSTRSASMAAPASAVFAQVNDFHEWQAWSPWAKAICQFLDMETMVGGRLEEGLASIKAVVESRP